MDPAPDPSNKATTTSFRDALALGLPLSSKGATHAASLPRGVKCDGARPVCGGCTRSALAHGEDPNTFACPYDDSEKPPSKRKRPASSTAPIALAPAYSSPPASAGPTPREKELERQLAILEAKLAAATSPSGSGSSFSSVHVAMDSGSFSNSPSTMGLLRNGGNITSPATSLDSLLQATTSQQPMLSTITSGFSSTERLFSPYTSDAGPSIPVSDDSYLLELLYPGWPVDLPSPGLVNRLLDVFFTKSHVFKEMINRDRFMASMMLPPSHHGFPHRSILHAILACTVRMVSDDFYGHEHGYWLRRQDGVAQEISPADYHAQKSRAAVDDSVRKGQALFHVQQAMVLLCYFWYTSARFIEVWLGCGLSTRLTGPLGLSHLRSKAQQELEELHGITRNMTTSKKANLLPPIKDDEEYFERSVTFWFTICGDRFASASTNWPVSLDELDITSLLPCRNPSLDTTDPNDSPLSIKNPNFFTFHPPHLVGPLQLYIKSIVLLGRVVTYMQRDGARDRYPPSGVVDIRTTAAFRKLENDAVLFRMSIPKEYQQSNASNAQGQSTKVDNRICVIHAMPHVATIIMHEPLVAMQDNDPSFAKCLASARSILASVYNLWSTSFDIGLLAPHINLAWSVAGRTLVREIAMKQALQPNPNTNQLVADVQVILAAMRAFKTPLGASVAHNLQILLDHPPLALPNADMTCSHVVPQHQEQTMMCGGAPIGGGGSDEASYTGLSSSPAMTSLQSVSPDGESPLGGNGSHRNIGSSSGVSPVSNTAFDLPMTPMNSMDPMGNLFEENGDEARKMREMQVSFGRFVEVAGLNGDSFGQGWK
ncbi:BQ5605_C048g12374 [Microbotryum silenes-dioicae]|uniref:BQ5605_C048g12374 protein n=1 Tax=Microbotryum silenes-dioicae TaxID=796604 RepID=A0A2X0NAX2_9BASI|nr:BQ5605_C048g12374 [Microbotryum silenes-dioicae]